MTQIINEEDEEQEQYTTKENQPKSILITGGAGFIGSHLSVYLCNKYSSQCKITIIDKLGYCSSKRNLSSIEGNHNYKFYHGNILDKKLVSNILINESIDTVIHLAAYTHVDHSFNDSLKFTKNNVLGTHVLLECCKIYGKIKRFIYVSTDEIYGSQEDQIMDEEYNYKPTNPYSASKASGELLVQSYYQSFSFPMIITRCNNVYGPNQYPEKLIPKFITFLLNRQACTIHGKGLNLRSYLYINDVVEALDIILNRGKIGEIYNVGADFEISNIQVARTLIESILGIVNHEQQNKYIQYISDRPFNDKRYHITCDKLKRLGWKKKVEWETGIALTITWYENNLNNWNNTSSIHIGDGNI